MLSICPLGPSILSEYISNSYHYKGADFFNIKRVPRNRKVKGQKPNRKIGKAWIEYQHTLQKSKTENAQPCS